MRCITRDSFVSCDTRCCTSWIFRASVYSILSSDGPSVKEVVEVAIPLFRSDLGEKVVREARRSLAARLELNSQISRRF